MQWTTEWPKEPGWYWMYDSACSGYEVVYRGNSGSVYDCVGGTINGKFAGYQFYGPIEQPPLPEQAKACSTSKSTQKSPQNA